MSKRRTKARDRRNLRSLWSLASLVTLLLILVGLAVANQSASTTPVIEETHFGTPMASDPPRAVVIDQLGEALPNPALLHGLRDSLTAINLPTDVIPSADVTLDFYRGLPTHNYRVVILRTHSTSDIQESSSAGEIRNRVGIFTSELYDGSKWLWEQMNGEVGQGLQGIQEEVVALSSDAVAGKSPEELVALAAQSGTRVGDVSWQNHEKPRFLFSSDFVRNRMEGRFDDALVIIAGCQSLNNADMAEALLDRGAAVVIGWDEMVDWAHNDRALERLLAALVDEGMTVQQAIVATMMEVGPDPYYRSNLTFYPQAQGKWRLAG